MPELTVYRTSTTPPPMVCMYCGAPATSTTEWQVENRRPERTTGGDSGADLTPTPTGDDPISGILAVILLPLVLWELVKGVVTGIGVLAGAVSRPRPAPEPRPKPKDPLTTRVVVTTCDRHRRFRDRFVWAGVAGGLALVGFWVAAILETRRVMGTENVDLAVTLVCGAILATVLLPLALSLWYTFAGPVIVDRVTEDTVVLDRVRRVYFEATGQTPADEVA